MAYGRLYIENAARELFMTSSYFKKLNLIRTRDSDVYLRDIKKRNMCSKRFTLLTEGYTYFNIQQI